MSDNDIFVISEVGEKGSPERKRADEIYEYVIGPAAQEKTLRVRRSDLDSTPGQVTTQIVQGIINARVIIADLTGRNPNVYYELGVAQAFGRPTILLVKDTGALPFDVRNERMIVIGDQDSLSAAQAKEATQALRKSLDVVLEPGFEVRNLVTEAASARSLDALAPQDPIASEVAAMRSVLDEILHHVGSRPIATSYDTDLEAMRAQLTHLASKGLIRPDVISALITENTSPHFDQWVRQIVVFAGEAMDAAAAEAANDAGPPSYEYGDEPF